MSKRTLCDDWACPSWISCRHHLGRSHAYAAMKLPAPNTSKFGRRPEAVCCDEYERDQPRPWLRGWPDTAPAQ